MARKLFISVLGAGFYENCVYVQDDFKSSQTRFIQQATLELIDCKGGWTTEDKICILLTDKAREVNWEVASRAKSKTDNAVPYVGLKHILNQMGLSAQVEGVSILSGMNENEMWKIFQTVFDLIEDGDELYFDLTHSFRYLPMLVLVLGNYAKFLKNIRIAHISYGNYEARNGNGAPIINLLPLATLQDWTFAAADFLRNGNCDQLVQLTKRAIRPILIEISGKDEVANSLQSLTNELQTITNNIQTCRGLAITQNDNMAQLKRSIETLTTEIIPPLIPVVKKIELSFANFSVDKNTLNGLHAARWCYDNRMYQQAITILQETIVSLICEQTGLSVKNDTERMLVNTAFYVVFNKKQQEEETWRLPNYGDGNDAKNKVKELIQLPIVNELSSSFFVATNLRNDFNHSGFRKNPMEADKIVKLIGGRIQKVYDILIPGNDVH